MTLRFLAFLLSILIGESVLNAQNTTTILPVTSIQIEGNSKTKESIILRELSFKVGQQLTEAELKDDYLPRSIAMLKNLNLFNDIDIVYKTTPEGFLTTIRVVEKWYWWPIPFVEFADRNFNQWYTFDFDPYRTNIGFYLFKYNLFGLNHTAKLTLGKGYTNTIGFEYIAPYVDNRKRFGFEIDIRNKINQEIQYGLLNNEPQFFRTDKQKIIEQFQSRVKLIYRPQLFLTHGLNLEISNTSVSDTVLSEGINENYLYKSLPNQNETILGYEVAFDKRNNRLLPIKGTFINGSINYHSLNKSDLKYVSVGLEAARYISFDSTKFSIALAGRVKSATERGLPFHLNKILGFDDYIRGYENNVFLGQSMALAKIEIRYHIIKERKIKWQYMPLRSYKQMPIESYLSAFTDIGSALNGDTRQELFGYGFGVNALFYFDKVVRFEYSWNHWNQGGIKIHFKKAF